MLQKEKSSEWDGSADCVNRLIVLAERELAAFFAAVNKNFGAEQASKSAIDWLEELEVMTGRREKKLRIGAGDTGGKSAAKCFESKKAQSRLRNPNRKFVAALLRIDKG